MSGREPLYSCSVHLRTAVATPVEKSRCLMCGAPEAVFWFLKSASAIWRCASCRSAFVWPRPSSDELERFYRSLSAGGSTQAEGESIDQRYRPTSWDDASKLVTNCQRLTTGRRLLDIGAGRGVLVSIATKCGFAADAIESNRSAATAFEELNGFRLHSVMFGKSFARGAAGQYDVAVLNQTLEHFGDPERAARNLHVILKAGGVAAIAVPQGASSSRCRDLLHAQRQQLGAPPVRRLLARSQAAAPPAYFQPRVAQDARWPRPCTSDSRLKELSA